MGKKNSFYLLEPFQSIPVAKPEEWLACIVANYWRPHAAYAPSEPREPDFKFHSDPNYSNVGQVLSSISSTSIKLALLDVLGISHEDLESKKHAFYSQKVERLRIHHDATVLEKALSKKEVGSEIANWKLDMFSPMYFVVGLLVTNHIAYESDEATERSFQGSVDPGKAASLTSGAATPFLPSSKIEAADSNTHAAKATLQASGKRVFAIEYRAFRRSLRQRPGRLGKLGGYGPQGDRTFATGDQEGDDVDVVTELDSEPFKEIVEMDGGEARCVDIETIDE